MTQDRLPRYPASLLAAFLLCFLYWTYLFFASEPHIIFDSTDYVETGLALYQDGWVKFFQDGPQREPLYIMVMALSHQLADMLNISHVPIMKFLQLLILFVTQLLTLKFLNKLNISPRISAAIILYMGFSPALVNSAFSFFSEIAAYPFVLLIVLAAIHGWRALLQNDNRALYYGLGMSVMVIGATCVKAIFNYVYLLFLLPFIFLAVKTLMARRYRQGVLILAFLVAALLPFEAFMTTYKSLNKKYNDHYEFTSRLWLLYGNTERRTTPMSTTRKLAAFASIPGEGACRMFFPSEDCDYWTIVTADGMAHNKKTAMDELGIPEKRYNYYFLKYSIERIWQHPFLYTYFYTVENMKLGFWESTQVGCVHYPQWLKALFDLPIISNGLRLIVSLMSSGFLIYLALSVWRGRVRLLTDEKEMIAFFVLWMIICFSLLNSTVQLIVRYIFPIVPLYFIAAGIFWQKILAKEK